MTYQLNIPSDDCPGGIPIIGSASVIGDIVTLDYEVDDNITLVPDWLTVKKFHIETRYDRHTFISTPDVLSTPKGIRFQADAFKMIHDHLTNQGFLNWEK